MLVVYILISDQGK